MREVITRQVNVKDLGDDQLYELNFQLDFMRLKLKNLNALQAPKRLFVMLVSF